MSLILSPKQSDFYFNCNARINIAEGAVRSGKTFVSYFAFLRALLHGPKQAGTDADAILIAKTERTAIRNIINPMLKLIGDENMSYVRGTGELTIFDKLVYVIGANDERAENKIRGMTVGIAYGDEVTLWPENFFVQLLARMSLPGSKLIGTTNPDSPFHWLKKGYIDRRQGIPLADGVKPINLKLWHFLLDDNFTLEDEYKNSLKSEYTGVWYKRYILGLWCMAEGLIYDMFEEEANVFPNDQIPDINLELTSNFAFKQFEIIDYWLSCDYGTGNPTVFLLNGRDRKGRHYVLREWRYDVGGMNLQKTDKEYSDALVQFLLECIEEKILPYNQNVRGLRLYIDPSAASFIQQLYRDGFKYVIKANNSVLDGIRTVGSNLSQRLLFIHRSCQGVLTEMSSYVWDEKMQEKGEDKPIKKHDHSLDALRYGEHSMKVPRKQSTIVGRTRQ